MVDRIKKLRQKMGVGSLIVTNQTNIRYLSGYRGDNGVLFLTEKEAVLITDFRYKESSKREVKNVEILITDKDIYEELVELPLFKKQKEIGFEKESIPYGIYERIKEKSQKKKLIPRVNLIEEMRMVKDADEVENIKKACGIGDRVLKEVLSKISPSMSEGDISAEIEFLMKRYGGEKASFDTIVAVGDNSALPHAVPTNRKIDNEGILLIDMGVFYNGYSSDMTRTILLKKEDRQREIYGIVYESQKRAIELIKPGIELKEIDRIARDYIKDCGYGDCFGHSLGHGVGLSVHELPRLSDKSIYRALEGMVFSVEPGIYLPGLFGVRIEDLILVTRDGYEVITSSPKKS